MTLYDETGYVAVGEIGMWRRRYGQQSPYGWEYLKVVVIAKQQGSISTWLRIRQLEADFWGNIDTEHRILARFIAGEDYARRYYAKHANRIWGAQPRVARRRWR